jgi:hypothetical protein
MMFRHGVQGNRNVITIATTDNGRTHDLLHALVVAVFRVGTDTDGRISVRQYPDRLLVQPYDDDRADIMIPHNLVCDRRDPCANRMQQ